MAKKKKATTKPDEPSRPTFEGFKPLAGGLEGFKAKIDAEQKATVQTKTAEAERGKAELAKRSPPKGRALPLPTPGRTSDLDDEMSFHRMMAGVSPLDQSVKARVPRNTEIDRSNQHLKAMEIRARAEQEAEQALAHLHSIVDGAARFEVSDDGKRVEGRRVDVSPELLRSLRRGMLPIDGRLDLHGLTAPQAREKLIEFLRTMRARSERCVLVIHGKGERMPGAGVLRGEISAWLSQDKAREHVAAFATARDEDGGEGAVYVALRK